MKLLKRLLSFAFASLMTVSSLHSGSLIVPAYAAELNPKLTVEVVGDGVVEIEQNGKIQFALETSPFEDHFVAKSKVELRCSGSSSTISDLTIDDRVVEGFEKGKSEYEYSLEMPNQSTVVKVVFESEKNKETSNQKTIAKTSEEENEKSKDSQEKIDLKEVSDNEASSNEEEPTYIEKEDFNIDYNNWKLTDEDQKMLADYAKGITDPYKSIRKEVAERTGLIKYTNDDYFLTDEFYDTHSFQMLIFDRTWAIDRNQTKEYKENAAEMATMDVNSAIQARIAQPRGMTVIDHAGFTAQWGVGTIQNGLWRLSNNRLAFCGNGMLAGPATGDATSDPRVVDNAALRKALYYGYLGPGNILGHLTLEQQIVATNDFVSYALTGNSVGISAVGGYHWNGWIKNLYNQVQAKPDPTNWVAYMVDVPGSGTNWAGQWVAKQPLVFGDWKPRGNIAIVKSSSNETITNGNNLYSLRGAQYTLYSDVQCTKALKIFNLNDGTADGSKVWDGPYEFDLGTYYLKETKAAAGYALDPKVYTVEVKATGVSHPSNGAPNWYDFEVKNIPQSNPVDIVVGKVDKQTNQNKPQGSGSLENAEFTVKFYAGSSPNLNGKATRTWVLKTDKDGYAKLSSNYKVSGDAFYLNSKGVPVLPLGTVTVQETKAPSGYYINSQVFTQKITTSGTSETVSTFNQIKVPELVNEFILTKVQIGTSTPIEGTVFTHTKPDGSTEDLKTDANGNISIKGLEIGTHKIKEKSVVAGYELNPNEAEFVVDQNGITMKTDLTGKDMTSTNGSSNSTAATLVVSDRVSAYDLKLVKVNEKDKKLPGAEFTIYSDKECAKAIETLTTNETGTLEFNNLKDRTDYYFKETKAPAGYAIPVDKDGNVHVYTLRAEANPAEGKFDFYVDGVKYTTSNTNGNIHLEDQDGNKVVSITVVNYAGSTLPETGSNLTMLLVGAGCLLFGVWYFKRKREQVV